MDAVRRCAVLVQTSRSLRLLQEVSKADTRHPVGACEVRGVNALRGIDVCFGIERQDASSSYHPIDLHGLGIEQLEVGDEVGPVIRRQDVAAGRNRSHCCLSSIGHGSSLRLPRHSPGQARAISIHTIVDKPYRHLRPSPCAWTCGGWLEEMPRRSGSPRA